MNKKKNYLAGKILITITHKKRKKPTPVKKAKLTELKIISNFVKRFKLKSNNMILNKSKKYNKIKKIP